jgi:hypothetical protein
MTQQQDDTDDDGADTSEIDALIGAMLINAHERNLSPGEVALRLIVIGTDLANCVDRGETSARLRSLLVAAMGDDGITRRH